MWSLRKPSPGAGSQGCVKRVSSRRGHICALGVASATARGRGFNSLRPRVYGVPTGAKFNGCENCTEAPSNLRRPRFLGLLGSPGLHDLVRFRAQDDSNRRKIKLMVDGNHELSLLGSKAFVIAAGNHKRHAAVLCRALAIERELLRGNLTRDRRASERSNRLYQQCPVALDPIRLINGQDRHSHRIAHSAETAHDLLGSSESRPGMCRSTTPWRLRRGRDRPARGRPSGVGAARRSARARHKGRGVW